MILKDKIQRILKEETLDFGKRTKSEKMIEKLIILILVCYLKFFMTLLLIFMKLEVRSYP